LRQANALPARPDRSQDNSGEAFWLIPNGNGELGRIPPDEADALLDEAEARPQIL